MLDPRRAAQVGVADPIRCIHAEVVPLSEMFPKLAEINQLHHLAPKV